MPPANRRRPLSLTDRQLEATAEALDYVLADPSEFAQRQVRRLVEAQAKVREEIDRRRR